MRKNTAQEVIELLLDFCTDIDKTLLRVKGNTTEEEFKKYTKAISYVLMCVFIDIMVPIIKQYPDLEPEELKR